MKEILKADNVMVEEVGIRISDGVTLKLYEFKPQGCDENAPVIVFVAGWVSLIEGWQDVLKVLISKYRVIYIETREKKSATLPVGEYPEFTIKRMAQDIHEVITERISKKTPFYIAGSSLGSTVTLDYLSNSDFRSPEKSVLISALGEVNFPFWGKLIINCFPPSAYFFIKHIVIFYLTNFRVDKKKEPEQAEKYRGTISSAEPKRLQANARTLFDYSVWDKLSGIDSEVIIVGAKTDKLHGVDVLKRMVRLIPKAKLEMMESNKETHSDKAGLLLIQQIEDINK